jgi:hypothetical protein
MTNQRKITLEDIIVQKREIDSVDMDGEIVMMDIDKGSYYGFNSVGSYIWKFTEKPSIVKDIVSMLLKEFEVDYKTCEKTVLEFLNRLHNEELITVV